MKRTVFLVLALALLATNLFARSADSLRFGRFGKVMLLESSTEKCSYPAADFEALSQYVQKQLNYSSYVTPVLVGYSSGATLVYATLVQAPSTTFRGAISLDFCPDLPTVKPFCKGSGLEWEPWPKGKGVNFLPAKNLEAPWIALQGNADQVCDPKATENFVKQVKNGEIVLLPKVGHGFSVQSNWMPQFKRVFSEIIATNDSEPTPNVNELKDLPLVEVPASESSNTLMALHITGDGGWGVTEFCSARAPPRNLNFISATGWEGQRRPWLFAFCRNCKS